jgi:hypothetical protein
MIMVAMDAPRAVPVRRVDALADHAEVPDGAGGIASEMDGGAP